MDDLKFEILTVVRNALPINPARRSHFYADTPNINRYKMDIDRLISSGYLREDIGSDILRITTPGDLAYEQEKNHRADMQRLDLQIEALREMADAAKADARAAEAQARAAEAQARAAEAQAKAAEVEAALAQKEAERAEKQAIDAEKDAAFARHQSIRSNRIAASSVALSLITWLFTKDDVFEFLSGLFQWLQNFS